jgi:hypothetical protein
MGQSILTPPDDRGIIKFDYSIDSIEEINPLFSKCFIRILYTGLNRNGVYIEKEVVHQLLFLYCSFFCLMFLTCVFTHQ